VRVLVVGHVTLDRYGTELLPGGAAYYAGHTYRALGASVRVVSAAGPRLPADALAGLEATVARSPSTTEFSNAYAPDGVRAQRVHAAAPPVDPAQLPAGWAEADLLHLAPVLGEVALSAWIAAVPARFVGIGVQGWVRRVEPDGTVSAAGWAPGAPELAGVSAAAVGEDDLRGQGDLAERLRAAIPAVAFTRGREGCELAIRGHTARVGVFQTLAVDPTGAGDAFAAAFFLGLARGDDPVVAARLGAAAASVVVEGRAGATLGRVGEAVARAAAICSW
jgi:1D-myo-inositol 3-kinase